MNIGAHVDESDAIGQARELGVPIVQILLGDPQSWRGPQISYPSGIEGLGADAKAGGIQIYVHAPYVINVASTNNRIRIPSRKLLQKILDAASQLQAAGVIVHGGHVTTNDEPERGYENWFKAVDSLDPSCRILIENTAGGKNAMMRFTDSMAKVWEAVQASKNADNVGLCFDTCHANGSGEDVLEMVERIKGFAGKIDLVHLNDSRDQPGTGADRHANLGQGTLGVEKLIGVLTATKAPAILETPGGLEAKRADLDWVKEHLHEN